MRHLLALTVLATALAGVGLPAAAAAPGVAAAAPGTAPGWRLVHRDDFGGSRLDPIWGRYSGPHGGEAASYYSPDQVAVSGGLLRLRMSERPSGGRRFATGAVGSWGLVQTYGRYEFRAKAPLGRGIDSYVTLWPPSQAPQQATLLEILARPGAEKAYLSNEYGSGETNRTVSGRFSDSFHTYVIEWAPRWFRILIDGQVRMKDTHASLVRKWIGFAVSSGDPLTGLPDSATRLPAEFQIDWVRIYAYDAKAAPLAPGPSASPSRSPSPTPTPPATATATATPSSTPASSPPTSPSPQGPVGPTAGPTVEAVNTSGSSPSRGLVTIAGAALLVAGGIALAFAAVSRSRRPRHGK
jgi:beta-glucanase (GH16 family)